MDARKTSQGQTDADAYVSVTRRCTHPDEPVFFFSFPFPPEIITCLPQVLHALVSRRLEIVGWQRKASQFHSTIRRRAVNREKEQQKLLPVRKTLPQDSGERFTTLRRGGNDKESQPYRKLLKFSFSLSRSLSLHIFSGPLMSYGRTSLACARQLGL